MPPRIDLNGKVFHRLTVIGYHGRHPKNRDSLWLCQCECGTQKIIPGAYLKTGDTKSCGCLKNKLKTIGLNGGSHVYKVWCGIKQRCNNKNDKDYKNYGGRGIKIPKEWCAFEAFYKDMGDPPSSLYTIDRIKNDKSYSKENCRWATSKQQARNRRNNRVIKWRGSEKTLIEWSETLGINSKTLNSRFFNKWTVERAFTQPVKHKGK